MVGTTIDSSTALEIRGRLRFGDYAGRLRLKSSDRSGRLS